MQAWLLKLNEHFPVRYAAWLACAVGCLLFAIGWTATGSGGCRFTGLCFVGFAFRRMATWLPNGWTGHPRPANEVHDC